MKPIRDLSLLLIAITICIALSGCATTTTEEELRIVPESSAEGVPSLEDGLKPAQPADKGADSED